jgi:hypothetical protein
MSKLLISLSALTIAAASSLAMAQGAPVGAKADAGGSLSAPPMAAPLDKGAAASTGADLGANAGGSDIKADVKANARTDAKGKKHAGHAKTNKGDSSAGVDTGAGAKTQ